MKKEKDGKKRKWLKPTIIVIAVLAVLGALFGEDDSTEPEEKQEVVEEVQEVVQEEAEEEVEEVDAKGWTENNKRNFRVITMTISDKFLSKYKTPWSNDEWTFAKFDDEGKVIVTTDYTLKDTSIKQPVMCVFTYNAEDESYKAHFLSVGDMVFLDDGSCDEFFEDMIEIMNSINE